MNTMNLTIPELSLVVLIGPSGAGKSTFARTHFKATEVLSSDFCRGLVSDDENDQSVTNDAFEVLGFIASKRLAAARLTVIDATNVQAESRKPLIALARKYHCLPVAIVLNLPPKLCHERNQERPNRNFGSHVVRRQNKQLKRSLRYLKREGFRKVYVLSSAEEVAAVTIERQPLWSNRKDESGPFDIIADVHGCCDELEQLLALLGYEWSEKSGKEVYEYKRVYHHPAGRKAVFLGDLVDRGPRILESYQLVRNMVEAGNALCVPGNHDSKLMHKLRGRKVKVKYGMEQTITELDALPAEVRQSVSKEMADFIYSLTSHYVLDEGKLVVAHAGMKEEMQGRGSGKVRDFALYGETTGETDDFGLPIRYNWAAEYRGKAMVVYGHTPVPQPEWLNNTINIDTGCVFGGKLTALRYPERELVSVAAARTYVEPIRPLAPPPDESPTITMQQEDDDLLDISDVLGKRIINTRLRPNITIREENTIAALEVMSRFAVNPKWLIYLPPTMSPTKTSDKAGLLEHPAEAFAYYRKHGVKTVVCEEKHMGSRAIVIVCRDMMAAQERFGVTDEYGICYTRTGRRFFKDPIKELVFLTRVQTALTQANFWEDFKTDWVCLDCELMPWSAKAQELLRTQYAAVGAASRAALAEVNSLLQQAASQGLPVEALSQQYQQRAEMAAQYSNAYRHYCWPVNSVDDLKLAPFHILATEGAVHSDKSNLWHLETIATFAQQVDSTSSLSTSLQMTNYKSVDLTDPSSEANHTLPSEAAAIAWWEALTSQGGEGMVIKPLDFISKDRHKLIQPALKFRVRS
jgi:protein phosphatase